MSATEPSVVEGCKRCVLTHAGGDFSLSVSEMDSTTLGVLMSSTLINKSSVPQADGQSGLLIIRVSQVLKMSGWWKKQHQAEWQTPLKIHTARKYKSIVKCNESNLVFHTHYTIARTHTHNVAAYTLITHLTFKLKLLRQKRSLRTPAGSELLRKRCSASSPGLDKSPAGRPLQRTGLNDVCLLDLERCDTSCGRILEHSGRLPPRWLLLHQRHGGGGIYMRSLFLTDTFPGHERRFHLGTRPGQDPDSWSMGHFFFYSGSLLKMCLKMCLREKHVCQMYFDLYTYIFFNW